MEDVALLDSFNAAAIAGTDGGVFIHPGDVEHWLFNGSELFDPAEVLTIWETNGRVDAWVLVSPRHAGYAAERAFVAEASNGALAAFTVTWHDHLNRTNLFEPVGTHSGYRRRGLGKALLLFAMRAMAAGGMETSSTGTPSRSWCEAFTAESPCL